MLITRERPSVVDQGLPMVRERLLEHQEKDTGSIYKHLHTEQMGLSALSIFSANPDGNAIRIFLSFSLLNPLLLYYTLLSVKTPAYSFQISHSWKPFILKKYCKCQRSFVYVYV